MRVTLIEAKELLGSFDASLREYAARKLTRQGIKLRKVREAWWWRGVLCSVVYVPCVCCPVRCVCMFVLRGVCAPSPPLKQH